jgi:hypothetical protein
MCDASIVFQNTALQMPVFAVVFGCFERRLVLPATLSAKSAIPDNKSYQERGLMFICFTER